MALHFIPFTTSYNIAAAAVWTQNNEFDILPHFQALDLNQLSGGREGNTNLDTGNMFRVFIFALCLPLTLALWLPDLTQY